MTINEAQAENRRHTGIFYTDIKRWLELLAKTITLGSFKVIEGVWESKAIARVLLM